MRHVWPHAARAATTARRMRHVWPHGANHGPRVADWPSLRRKDHACLKTSTRGLKKASRKPRVA